MLLEAQSSPTRSAVRNWLSGLVCSADLEGAFAAAFGDRGVAAEASIGKLDLGSVQADPPSGRPATRPAGWRIRPAASCAGFDHVDSRQSVETESAPGAPGTDAVPRRATDRPPPARGSRPLRGSTAS